MIEKMNFNRKSILIVCVLFFAIVTGIAIADKTWIYLGVVFVPLILYLCIHKQYIFPFGLYVFLLPLDSVLVMTGVEKGATLTRLLGVLTIIVFIVKGLVENKLIKPDTAALWWTLFIMYSVLTVFWAPQPELALAPTVIGLFILYLVVASYKIQKSEFETLKWCILAGGIMAAIFAIYNYQAGHLISERRATVEMGGHVTNPNKVAYSLQMPIAVCIAILLRQNKKIMKCLFCCILSVMLFSIIITGARGSMLGVAATFIVYIISMKNRITFITLLVVVGILLTSFLPDVFFERWGKATETGGGGRLGIWYVGWWALKKYWLFGVGFNNFPNAYNEYIHYSPEFMGYGYGAHNSYIGHFVELGIFGFAILIVAIIKHYPNIRSQFNKYDIDAIMLKAAFCAILIDSFFGDKIMNKSFWLLWMMILMYRNCFQQFNSNSPLRVTNDVIATKRMKENSTTFSF